jgi:hypothetical protein
VTIPVGPGQLYLIDASAHARRPPPVRNVIAGLSAPSPNAAVGINGFGPE